MAKHVVIVDMQEKVYGTLTVTKTFFVDGVELYAVVSSSPEARYEIIQNGKHFSLCVAEDGTIESDFLDIHKPYLAAVGLESLI